MGRAARLEAVRISSPEERFSAYLDALDDDFLACKAGRHSIPKITPAKVPDGIEVRRRAGGIYQVTLHCLDCGLPCTATTEKGGVLGAETRWEYDYAALPGYLAPKGSGRGRKAEYKAELGQRVAPVIRQAAARSASEAAAAKRKAAAEKAARTPKKPRPSNTHGSNPRAVRHARDGERRVTRQREDRTRDVPGVTFLPGQVS